MIHWLEVGRTLYQVLEDTAARYGDAPALRQPVPGRDDYTVCSWNAWKLAAGEIAAGLRSLGLAKGDIVALSSETRLEFYLADLGIVTGGCVSAALYPSYPPRDLVRTLEAAGAKAALVENPAMLATLRDAPVRHWILLSGWAEGVPTLEDIREMGRAAMARDPLLLARLLAETQPSDPAVLYLTSGATGEPKMALVTHQAITSNIDMGPAVLPIGPDDATVAFLPSAHIAQRVVMEFLPMRCGMPVTFSESLLKLPQEIRKVRPTILLAPPRMWERIYSTICTELRKRPAPARKAFYAALALALAAARYRREGKPVPARIRAPLKIADLLFFRRVRARFGGRLQVAASGAAPLGKSLGEFYEAIGMPIIEGYGLTEGGVATLNPLDAPKPGSIGKPLAAGVELRLSPEGELLIKSPCLFSGYLNDPGDHRRGAARRLAAHRRPGAHRWRRLRLHHRPQEGADRLLHRQEDLPFPRREPLQDGAADQPGAADRRPPSLPHRAVHPQFHRRRRLEGHGRMEGPPGFRPGAGAARAGRDPQSRRAREQAARSLRAGAQIPRPGARLLHRGRRIDRHHEGPAHARHGEFQGTHRGVVRRQGVRYYSSSVPSLAAPHPRLRLHSTCGAASQANAT